jgi:hypothetical protein
MNRRKFAAVAGIAAAGVLGRAQSAEKIRFLALDTWQLKNGSEVTRLNDWLGNNLVPAVSKLTPGPVLVLEAVFAPRVPQIMMLTGYSSFEQIAATQDKLNSDAALKAAYEKIEAVTEPLYETRTTSILEPTPYSPAIAVEKRDKARYYEVRIYHAPTEWQFRALHDRMLGPVAKLFKVHGIEPLFYSTTRVGPNMPNITYMIPWDSLAAREKAWDAFGADPEWVKARKDSIDKSGQIVTMNDIEIYRATAYSPVK